MTNATEHKNAPHNQPFQLKNCDGYKSKSNSWWNPKSDKFWRLKMRDKKLVK